MVNNQFPTLINPDAKTKIPSIEHCNAYGASVLRSVCFGTLYSRFARSNLPKLPRASVRGLLAGFIFTNVAKWLRPPAHNGLIAGSNPAVRTRFI